MATSLTPALSIVSRWTTHGIRFKSKVRMRPPPLQTGTLTGRESRRRWIVLIHAISPARVNTSVSVFPVKSYINFVVFIIWSNHFFCKKVIVSACAVGCNLQCKPCSYVAVHFRPFSWLLHVLQMIRAMAGLMRFDGRVALITGAGGGKKTPRSLS